MTPLKNINFLNGVLFAGITASGADAFLLHVTTVPSVVYVVRDFSVYRSYDGMRVGMDCSNGNTFNIAKSVFDALGTKTYVVGMSRTVPTSIWDADRCIVVDENGMEGTRIISCMYVGSI